MPEGQVLEFSGVTKRFGAVAAVSGFSARVEPGSVTGFLGPNGAGKTTSLRILLGLVRADQGTATIGGVPYAKLANPLSTVGAALEASSFHPGRTAANHLKVYAIAAGLPLSRVDETLAMVGLADAAGRKVGGFSLGMRQRLGLAYTLLGDPGVLVLDEPANGLDPEGIKWMRGLLRELARQGRTVLVSSHLLAEVQQTVDSLLIIAQGRLVFQGRMDELTDPSEYATVIDAPDRAALGQALTDAGIEYEMLRTGLTVRGMDTAVVGRAAAEAGVALSGLQRRGPALEEVFLELVSGLRVYVPRQGQLEAPAAVAVPAEPGPDAAGAAVGVAGAAGTAVSAALAEVAADRPAEEDGVTGDAEGDAAESTADGEPVSTDTATFAVAITGVIDIIPAEVAADAAETAPAADTGDAADAEPDSRPDEPDEPEFEVDGIEPGEDAPAPDVGDVHDERAHGEQTEGGWEWPGAAIESEAAHDVWAPPAEPAGEAEQHEHQAEQHEHHEPEHEHHEHEHQAEHHEHHEPEHEHEHQAEHQPEQHEHEHHEHEHEHGHPDQEGEQR